MIIQMPEEIVCLKDSEQILQKIEKIKTMLHENNVPPLGFPVGNI